MDVLHSWQQTNSFSALYWHGSVELVPHLSPLVLVNIDRCHYRVYSFLLLHGWLGFNQFCFPVILIFCRVYLQGTGWEGKGRYAKAGMVHSVSGWTWGVQVKLWDPLRTHAIPERLRGVITTRHYTNLRLPLPLPLLTTIPASFSTVDIHAHSHSCDLRVLTQKAGNG